MLRLGQELGYETNEAFGTSRDIKANLQSPCVAIFQLLQALRDNCGIGLKDKLQKFQNRDARVISAFTYDIRSIDVLDQLASLGNIRTKT